MFKYTFLLLTFVSAILGDPPSFIKGIYITSDFAGKGKIDSIINQCDEAGVNTFVIDLKTMTGHVSFTSGNPLAQEIGSDIAPSILNPYQLFKRLKSKGFYIIGRTTLFYDDLLSTKRPDLALYLYGETEKDTTLELIPWVNPAHPEVLKYNKAIIERAISFGLDEIQLDYARYPASNKKLADFSGEILDKKKRKSNILNYCKTIKKLTNKRNIKLSIDIFGVTAWNRKKDTEKLGQDLLLLAKEVDYICPMFYPSHFYDFTIEGKEADKHPELLLELGCRKIQSIISDSLNFKIRPWLQSFTYRVDNFNYFYILSQIFGCMNSHCNSFLFWNAGVKYDSTFKALKMLKTIENVEEDKKYIDSQNFKRKYDHTKSKEKS